MLKSKAIYLIFVAAFLLPAQGKSETLADALVSAYEHSGLIFQNRALLRAADEDVAQVVSRLRPIIDWSAEFDQEYGRIRTALGRSDRTGTGVLLSFTAELLVYDFGRTRMDIESAKETVLATRQDLLNIEQQVLLRAVTAYLNVITARRIVALRENNVRVIDEQLQATYDRFEVGEVTRTDVAQAEARLAEARGNLSVAEGDLAVASAEYKSAIGHAPGKLTYPKQRPRFKNGEKAAIEVALRKEPQLQSARHAVTAADINIESVAALVKPSISLFGQGNLDDSLDNDTYLHGGTFGVRATGPIYQGGRLASLRREAIDQRDAQLGQMHFIRHNVRQGVSSGFARLEAAIATEKANKEAVRAQEVAFNGVRDEATFGARTTLDVLDAEQELLDARVALVIASVEVYQAAYEVLDAMGELTVKDLKLKTPTYDPTVHYNLSKDAPVNLSRQGQQLDKVLDSLKRDHIKN